MESGSKIQCLEAYNFLPYYACNFHQPIKKIIFFTVSRATRDVIQINTWSWERGWTELCQKSYSTNTFSRRNSNPTCRRIVRLSPRLVSLEELHPFHSTDSIDLCLTSRAFSSPLQPMSTVFTTAHLEAKKAFQP